MFGAVAMLFVLPWLDTSKVRSMRYRPIAKQLFVLFVLASIGLGFCGANDPDKFVFKFGPDQLVVNYVDANGVAQASPTFASYDGGDDGAAAFARSLPPSSGAAIAVSESGFKWLWLSQILGAYYFLYFLVFLPLLGIIEKPKARPPSIAESVRHKSSPASPAAVAAE
jgi:ubiquinol-cytochrome c reductase cytochrome b subunit